MRSNKEETDHVKHHQAIRENKKGIHLPNPINGISPDSQIYSPRPKLLSIVLPRQVLRFFLDQQGHTLIRLQWEIHEKIPKKVAPFWLGDGDSGVPAPLPFLIVKVQDAAVVLSTEEDGGRTVMAWTHYWSRSRM